MKKLVAACAFGLAVSSVFAAKTNTWTSAVTAGHWGDVGIWGGQSIEEGDCVLVPKDMTAKIVDADIETVNKLRAILTPELTSTVEFDIEGECEVTCMINKAGFAGSSGAPAGVPYANRSSGKIVKNGTGSLWLKNWDGLYSYLTAEITVNNGLLRLPCVSNAYRNMNYGKITVNAPGVLYPTSWNGDGSGKDPSLWCTLAGDGVISNPAPYRVCYFPMCGSRESAEDFSGRIVGIFYSYGSSSSRCQNYLGTGSDNPAGIQLEVNSVVGMADIGGISNDGSITNRGSFGYGPISMGGNSTLVYRGTGGVSYGQITDMDSSKTDRLTLEGGETGGLRFLGTINFNDLTMARLCLAGDHTNDCSIEGVIQNKKDGAIYITKKGSGTWSFLGKSSHDGVLAVENGTLKFDSISNRGIDSALGLSSILREDVATNSASALAEVPYAFLLGAQGTTGTLEYVGSRTGISEDRAVALKGDGAIKASAGRLVLSGGVSAASAGTHTLTLGGTAANCQLGNVADGDVGKLKIVKEGVGSWTLDGNQSFTGGLEVRGGTLRICDTAWDANRYAYYRFVMENKAGIAKLDKGTGNVWFNVGRLGFFNEKGEVQNAGLEFNDQARNNPARLAPGEYSYEIGEYVINGNNYKDPYGLYCNAANGSDNLFAVDSAHADAYMAMFHKINNGNTSWWPYTKDDTVRTVTIVLRLPLEAEPVTSYDVGQHLAWNTTSATSNNGANNIGEWHIEASVDGTTWETVSTVKIGESYPAARDVNCWLKDNTSYATEDGWQKHTTGWTIPSVKEGLPAAPAVATTRFANGIDDVSVTGGGTLVTTENLTINSLTVDADAADKSGTINGFAFAEGGTIAVTGAAAKLASVKIPLAFANATNLANVNGWSVTYNGKPVRTVKVYATEVGLELAKTGLSVIVK